ncbi:glycosyltransferase family 2 protein [bacterium]|nr:glycosyltransferase family 2 protein [bacterium]
MDNLDPDLISVVVPCFGMGRFIGKALSSIETQTHTSWEVIVIDDGGPDDGTSESVKVFAERHPGQRVEFRRLAENKGVSAARNTGASMAKGSLLAFLDPDDLWREDHLESHLTRHRVEAAAVVTTSRAEVFRGDNPDQVQGEWGYTDWEKSIFPRSLALRNVIIPSTVVMPAEYFREVGGFDETRSLQHTEDWDLWIRLVESGLEFCFLEQFTVLYRRHDGGATADRRLMRVRVQEFSSKNHERLFTDLGLSVSSLAFRVDALESRLNWLQRNPFIRLISAIQKLLKKK